MAPPRCAHRWATGCRWPRRDSRSRAPALGDGQGRRQEARRYRAHDRRQLQSSAREARATGHPYRLWTWLIGCSRLAAPTRARASSLARHPAPRCRASGPGTARGFLVARPRAGPPHGAAATRPGPQPFADSRLLIRRARSEACRPPRPKAPPPRRAASRRTGGRMPFDSRESKGDDSPCVGPTRVSGPALPRDSTRPYPCDAPDGPRLHDRRALALRPVLLAASILGRSVASAVGPGRAVSPVMSDLCEAARGMYGQAEAGGGVH